MKNIGVLGASGYAGAEVVRILLSHPLEKNLRVSSISFEGKTLDSIYPALTQHGKVPLVLENAQAVIDGSDVVFACLSNGLAEPIAQACHDAGKLFIDLSADFRFGTDEATYATWYGKGYSAPALHAESVYGLPELNRAAIAKAKIIGNPGCYPTSAELGLYPALANGFADTEGIIIDSASGVTGSGREPNQTTHFAECADSISPYKVGSHRHQPEIDRYLSQMAGSEVSSVFTPHLAPMGRGIVSTIYFRLKKPMTVEALHDAYKGFYEKEQFVRVLPLGSFASNHNVKFSNFCDISVHLSANKKMGIVVSCIDNMVKGAAGQAVQNMNLALGLDEAAGLGMVPPAF